MNFEKASTHIFKNRNILRLFEIDQKLCFHIKSHAIYTQFCVCFGTKENHRALTECVVKFHLHHVFILTLIPFVLPFGCSFERALGLIENRVDFILIASPAPHSYRERSINGCDLKRNFWQNVTQLFSEYQNIES